MVKEKCTPWELHGEVEQLIASNVAGITVENSELIREWCLAAGQTTTPTRCTPAVVLKVNAVHSDDERFAYWAYHRLSSTLGRPEVEALSANPTQHMSLGQSAEAIQRMAEAVH